MLRVRGALALCLLPVLAAAQPPPPVQLLHTFVPAPGRPTGPLLQVPDGSFYGATENGIVRLAPGGQVTEVARLASGTPRGALVRASDGALYGVTSDGGVAGRSTVFRFDPATHAFRTLHDFDSIADGDDPIGGLVEIGGSLYGVTAQGPGVNGRGTIFHVVLATGAVVTDHVFATSGVTPANPTGPLVLAPDGRLYGTSQYPAAGALYRFDPPSGSVEVVHQMPAGDAWQPYGLTVCADGRLCGVTSGGPELAGTFFRYTLATGAFERIYALAPSNGVDGRHPSALLAADDGHLYGTAMLAGASPAVGTLFRLRLGAGGTVTYEALRSLDAGVSRSLQIARLTQGADGSIYAASYDGGPTDTGTIFRFDPLGGGSPGDPLAFTVLHAFPLSTTWRPSAPRPAADGFLYGLTSRGGANNRGLVYRLDAATGAVTTLGTLPGAWAQSTINSSLVAGPDGFLYGTSTASAPDKRTHVIRVDPAAGVPTVAAGPVGPTPSPATAAYVGVMPGLVRTPAGQLYGLRYDTTAAFVYRVDPVAGTVTDVATSGAFNSAISPLLATSAGEVLVVANVGTGPDMRSLLLRLNPAAPSGFDRVTLGQGVTWLGGLAERDGSVYLAGRAIGGPARVSRVDLATGQLAPVCDLDAGDDLVRSLTAGADGAFYGFVAGDRFERFFRCDVATGASTVAMLPTGVGRSVEALVPVGSLLYGASFGSAGDVAGEHPGGALFRLAAAGTLPALDSDGDLLPSAWETAYGLDPFDAGHGSGSSGDPDGDGRTNAQELADGTHPRGFVTRLFAEGASNAFFRTTFDLANPGRGPGAIVRARILTDAGVTIPTDVVLPPSRHRAFDPATLPGAPQGSYSAIFESDEPIAVDRAMTWDATGYGSHLETGIVAPSTTWYFAEGSTSGEFSLFYLLQNPQATAVTATVRYLRPFGQPPLERTYTLPPASRTTIVVHAQGPELASTDVSAAITASAPIVAERAMYVNRPGQPFAAGHESAGVTAPGLDWFLAEGATGAFFDLFVLIANPASSPAAIAVEYLRSSGPPLTRSYVVPAQSRMTIWVDDEQLPAGSGQKPLADGSVSTSVRVTNGVPVIVERAMWWPGPAVSSSFWYEAHNSPGARQTATRWVIAGTELGGTDDADTFVLIANTADRPGTVWLRLLGDDFESGLPSDATLVLPPKSRTTVDLRTWFGGLTGRWAVVVGTREPEPLPLVVERATYASPGGVFWGRGGNALAEPLP